MSSSLPPDTYSVYLNTQHTFFNMPFQRRQQKYSVSYIELLMTYAHTERVCTYPNNLGTNMVIYLMNYRYSLNLFYAL